MEEVKLLGFWASGYAYRVQLALKVKCIPFDYIEQDLSNKSQLLQDNNPVHKKVPVLIHNGKPICESLIILEFIEETWPTAPRLMPSDPYDRYLVRFWSDFVDKKWREVLAPIFNVRNADERSVIMKKAQEEYEEMVITLEKGVSEMEQRGLLYDHHEKQLQYMDVFFVSWVAWFGPLGEVVRLRLVESGKCPCLIKWMQNLLTNNVVKSTLPDSDKLTQHLKNMVDHVFVE